MLSEAELRAAGTVDELAVEWPGARGYGKVREWFGLTEDRRLLVATDRLSAFDRVLARIPCKGQVLNQLSAFWFRETADIVPNHLLATPDPNVSLVQSCRPLPVEVIVRGYITGVTSTALWTLYEQGERVIYGHRLPGGLRKNDRLPTPLITPTTKGGPGQHDERLTCAEVISKGLVEAETWERVQAAALAVFARGQELAQRMGLVLVDTKYEFGLAPDGRLMLIDEVHTPDSSRFWTSDSLAAGQELVHWDKEYVRLWYAGRGYRGEGEPPTLDPAVQVEAARRYIALYEGLTGETLVPSTETPAERIAAVVRGYATEAG